MPHFCVKNTKDMIFAVFLSIHICAGNLKIQLISRGIYPLTALSKCICVKDWNVCLPA